MTPLANSRIECSTESGRFFISYNEFKCFSLFNYVLSILFSNFLDLTDEYDYLDSFFVKS